jgi:hypothetical protein
VLFLLIYRLRNILKEMKIKLFENFKTIDNVNKQGSVPGPGLLEKEFSDLGKKNSNIEIVDPGQYHIDLLVPFIKERNDRIRHLYIIIDYI